MSGNWWGWVTETMKDMPNRYLSISMANNIGTWPKDTNRQPTS